MDELIAELSLPAYASMTDQEAADAINAKTVSRSRLVPIWEVKQLAIISGYWPVIKAGQLNDNPQVAGLCLSVIDWIDDPKLQTIDVNLPAVQAMLGGLVVFGLITQLQANEIIALGTETVAFLSILGAEKIGAHHVSEARNA